MTPVRYFADIVGPDFRDFFCSSDDIRLAMHACVSLSHFIEIFIRFSDKRGSTSLKQYCFGDKWDLNFPSERKKSDWMTKEIRHHKNSLPSDLREAQKICESISVSFKHLYVENTHLCAISAGSNVIAPGSIGGLQFEPTPDPNFESALYLVKAPELPMSSQNYETDSSVHLLLTEDAVGKLLQTPTAVEVLPYASKLIRHCIRMVKENIPEFQSNEEDDYLEEFDSFQLKILANIDWLTEIEKSPNVSFREVFPPGW